MSVDCSVTNFSVDKQRPFVLVSLESGLLT